MSSLNLEREWAFEKVCPVCGKRFYITPDWVYKVSVRIKSRQYAIKYQCSYSCYKVMKPQDKGGAYDVTGSEA